MFIQFLAIITVIVIIYFFLKKERSYKDFIFQQKKNQEYLNNQKDRINQELENFKKNCSDAAEAYSANLQKKCEIAEFEYQQKVNNFEESLNNISVELEQMQATRAAAQKAILKEKEIKEQKDNYRLLPIESDLMDIQELMKVKRILRKPRILSMLIWQTYWQPLAKKKFPIILKGENKTGVYKITNIQTSECYIGQAVDVYKRWCSHCKCGLGIDAPPRNKLYKAIDEFGLDNFTFELLLECSKEELNEKERFFIQFYNSDTFGYNSTKGNN